jgi:hypothetical protein
MTSDDLPESAAATAAPATEAATEAAAEAAAAAAETVSVAPAPAILATEAATEATTEAGTRPAPRPLRPALRPSDTLWDQKKWRISGSVGETTIRQHSNLLRPELFFYTSFACPLSQILWIVLEEYHVKYKWIEVRFSRERELLRSSRRVRDFFFSTLCDTNQPLVP